jgi:hypothetical protein
VVRRRAHISHARRPWLLKSRAGMGFRRRNDDVTLNIFQLTARASLYQVLVARKIKLCLHTNTVLF